MYNYTAERSPTVNLDLIKTYLACSLKLYWVCWDDWFR